MRVILAFDNDQAGYATVWRFLESHIKDIYLPLPPISEWSTGMYCTYFKRLNITGLLGELQRLKVEDDPETINQVALLRSEFQQRKDALEWKDPVKEYEDALA
jgi:hypothetical protein